MARYVNIDNVTIPKGFFDDLNVPKLFQWLNTLPTVDMPNVRHGQWINDGNFKACSKCMREVSKRTIGSAYWNYCPHCGTRMDNDKCFKENSEKTHEVY